MTMSRNAPLYVDAVTLIVRDLIAMRGFYERALGLEAVEEADGAVGLGAGGRVFLRLAGDPSARIEEPRSAGLFHLAILLPTRADLARWLSHAAEIGLPLDGASDHGVSEAAYLSDPEGNGVEIYWDKPTEVWPRDAKGGLAMVTERLDQRSLAAELETAGGVWSGAPAGTVLGHAHLRVGSVEAAKAFYGEALGFDHMQDYPGAAFFSTGGYHHHLGANIWRARGAGRRAGGQTGLAELRLLGTAEALARAKDGLKKAGIEAEPIAGGVRVEDPWGLGVRLEAA